MQATLAHRFMSLLPEPPLRAPHSAPASAAASAASVAGTATQRSDVPGAPPGVTGKAFTQAL
eukprot:scaffold136801_cov23-Tisochrysis_lutea.AAC.1